MLEEEISKIKHYVRHGEPKKALEYIESIDKKKLSNLERDILDLYKAEALVRYGLNEKYEELIEELTPKFAAHDIPKYNLIILIHKANLHNSKHQEKEALKVLKQKEKILNSLSKEKLDELYEERIGLLFAEGTIYFSKRDFEQFAKVSKESLKLAEKNNDKHYVGVALINLADSHGRMGQSEKAWDFREEALRVFKELNNEYRIAFVQHYYGHHYTNIGEYDKAIEHYLKLMPFVEKTENAYQKIVIFYHLAWVYFANLQNDIAHEYNLKAYQLLDKINRLDVKDEILGRLITCSIDLGEFDKADKYIEELKPILQQIKKSDYDSILRYYEYRKAMKRFHDTGDNQIRDEIEREIREIINDKSIADNLKWNYKITLCNLLLHEYLETRNNELIDEIVAITSNLLENLSKYDRLIPRIAVLSLRLFALWIRAKIHGDEKKLEEVQELLSKTVEYAGVKGNKLLLNYLEHNRERFAALTDEMIEIIEKYAKKN